MADRNDNPMSQDETFRGETDAVLERVQELSWALLDDQITEGELALLDNLLLSCDKARATYVGCVYLHTDLMSHFASMSAPDAAPAPANSPVLGFLHAGMPPVGMQSPPEEDASS